MRRNILITHNDMDAAISAVLFKRVFGNFNEEIYYCNYKNVDNVTIKVLGDCIYSRDTIYFVDICPKEDTIKELFRTGIRFKIIDHHKSAEKFNAYEGIYINTKYCGAKLFYKYILENFIDLSLELGTLNKPSIEQYKDIVDIVDDYDRWIHNNPLSIKFNTLFGIMRMYKFVERFCDNPKAEMTVQEKFLISIEEDRINTYIKYALDEVTIHKDNEGRMFGFVFAESNISLLSHEILKTKEVDYAIVVNMKKGLISYRANGKVDVSLIAERIGGGGHCNSSGSEIKDMNSILNSLLSQIKVI